MVPSAFIFIGKIPVTSNGKVDRSALPPLASNFVQLIKYSSLGSVISVTEITRRGTELSASTFRPLEIFSFIALVYFCICWPLAMAIRIWERRLASR